MAPLRERVLQFLHATVEEGQKSAGQLLREVQMTFDNLSGAQWQLVREIVSQFPTRNVPGAGAEREREHEDEGDDGLDTALGETFCSYNPGLVGVGNPHPAFVDICATLASIPQPACTYKAGLPTEVMCRRLSQLQLETVLMACQRFQGLLPDGSRQGFFLGDGAGMGKGRQIGGLLYELLLREHRKAVWFSASSGLHYDAERDIGDLGALKYMKLHRLDQYGYGDLPMDSGVLFSTYTMLVSVSSDGTSRLDQIVDWLGEDFEGLLVFDEAHKAKNGEYINRKNKLVKGTITAAAVFELQRRLSKARVVYVSATAVTEPHHLAYMPRLGLWGQGASLKDFPALLKMCSQGGVGAMEILCMEMKMRGMFLSSPTATLRRPRSSKSRCST
ncbi:Nuclear helicase [Klebsormidium nitens]|uniref:Nuclear helicase n=1 Tax=Klebsormidium nitens TaxID=105231 RepID=A0A1Y1HR20_KLENI|nr:Nuclear helicase [Klebsormidium nitens]|eukprot:GAQ81070.1 Nuclear helicase [Klebsormidium nitens]